MLFFPLLLWSILGHGFRYGRLYLAVSAVLSTVLFILVVSLSPAWHGLAVLDGGLAAFEGELEQGPPPPPKAAGPELRVIPKDPAG